MYNVTKIMLMKTKKENLFAAHRLSILCCLATVILLAISGGTAAQTVSIGPKTGNVVSAASYSSESHLDGFGGVWVHNQLPMTLVTSDKSTLTDAGLMAQHANNVAVVDGQLVFASGEASDVINHISLSLPKGYRFTSYKMVMDYDTQGSQASTFREMDSGFSDTKETVTVSSSTKGAVLQRTSLSPSDMGNILYFRQDHSKGMARVKVTSFVITFECTDKFNEVLAPEATSLNSAVSCITLPFETERVDLGKITQQEVNNYTSYKYDYNNVKDLRANFLFYDESGMVGGAAVAGTTGDKTISAIVKDDERSYLGLKNGTYWLEVPTDALEQDGKTRIPVGYRIVGARVVYSNSKSTEIKRGDDIYITDGKDRYMNADLEFTKTKVVWKYDTDGKVHTTSGSKTVYLRHKVNFWGDTSLSTTNSQTQATAYDTDGQSLYYEGYVISCSAKGKGVYNVDGANAVAIYAGITSSDVSFTLKLYDKKGEAVATEAVANAASPAGELTLEKLNNDAIKLQVEGLTGDQLAYVALEVQLEALNPYIDKMEISCTQPSGEKKLKNQYLADDFTIGTNGKVDFSVPTNFGTTGLRFAFEGLHNKNADETYPNGSEAGHSRYHFVRSAYYDLIGESLQDHRADAAGHDYRDKVRVDVAGNKAFRSNNADQFKAGTSGSGTFYYEETRYTDDAYTSQGGQWKDMTVNSGDGYVKRYLIVCDETRYNIAPTTKPRHAYYAYYATDLRLSTVDYKPVLTYRKVYNNAVTPSGPDDNYYVGATVSLTDADDKPMAEGVGYVYAKQVVDQIAEDIEAKKTNAPVDAKHILYFDASRINSLLFSDTDASWGNLVDLKKVLGLNALIFLPKGVTASDDNVATKAETGDDFVAENDIVLTDQYPFFSPHDIRVNAANEVNYTRRVTPDKNTKKWVTVMLPFTIAVDGETGTYGNEDDQTAFTFYQMNTDNAFSRPKGSDLTFTDIDGHFSPYTGQRVTQPNEAYVVRIDEAPVFEKDPAQMFVVRQSGATIVKTPVTAEQPLITCGTSTGTVDGSQMTLTNQATYAGASVPVKPGMFYFNKDRFVSSLNVTDRFQSIYVLPFRSYYACDNTAPNSVRYIHISTEPNSGPTDISGPTDTHADEGLTLTTQEGRLSVKANRDLRLSIRNLNGQTLSVASLREGETRSVALPSGIYVVNGVKVAVK